MLKKDGVNLIFFIILTVLFSIFSCSGPAVKSATGILLQTDREFSDMSEREGMFKAFLEYIAGDGVILRDNSYPSEGREALAAYYEGKSDTAFILTWEPAFEMLAESGELGYTYGTWTNRVKESGEITRGTYTTFWKKQADGNWKFILDTGTQGLPE
jgi:ketosteroid isomerase-like protein